MRLADVAEELGRHDEALAACERGLQHADGPILRNGLQMIRAGALLAKGQRGPAREALAEAEKAANAIGNERVRRNKLGRVSKLRAQTGP